MSDDSKNMVLWEKVAQTNPKNTKTVKLGRTFTAIDPYSQIREATQVFGPAGVGWGWEVKRLVHLPTQEMGVLIRLWHGSKEQVIEQWGQAGYYLDRDQKRKDEDCFKKATTDAITKCLSYLGFNADVFTGQFDDNKYVAKMRQEFEKRERVKAVASSAAAANCETQPNGEARPKGSGLGESWLEGIEERLKACETMHEVKSLYEETVTTYAALDASELKARYEKAMRDAKSRVAPIQVPG
jgi:hypothetical protein